MRYIDDRPAPPLDLTPDELKEKIKQHEIERFGRVVTCWPEDEKELYIIAMRPRRFGERTGCIAWRTAGGRDTADYIMQLGRRFPGIDIMAISDPEAYGEYAPYDMRETRQEFERAVRKLSKIGKKRRE